MKRRIVCLAVSVSTIVGMAVISAPTAAAASGGSCTGSYSLVRASRWGAEGQKIDRNGNGWVCQKPISANPPGSFNVIDDKA